MRRQLKYLTHIFLEVFKPAAHPIDVLSIETGSWRSSLTQDVGFSISLRFEAKTVTFFLEVNKKITKFQYSMDRRRLQYYLINGIFTLCLVYLFILFGSFLAGIDISPKSLINALILVAYAFCMIGFNWPTGKRLKLLRIVGLSYSFIMLILSLFVFNNVIDVKQAWNLVLSGLCISFMMTVLFQIYRIPNTSSGYLRSFKWIATFMTIIEFGFLFMIFVFKPQAVVIFQALSISLAIYSLVLMGYFLLATFQRKSIA